METKKCCTCGYSKQLDCFGKDSKQIDELCLTCKECRKKSFTKTYHSKKGVIAYIWRNQNQNSKKRGMNLPTYTKKDLSKWLMSQEKFHHLFHLWEVSNFDSLLKPSVDRINDYDGYTFSNIQLMTWSENQSKACKDRAEGRNNKISDVVLQYSANGKLLGAYHSTLEAQRETGVDGSGIHKACSSKSNYAGGYRWGFASSLRGGFDG